MIFCKNLKISKQKKKKTRKEKKNRKISVVCNKRITRYTNGLDVTGEQSGVCQVPISRIRVQDTRAVGLRHARAAAQ